jgi:hypothetical protein
MKSRTVLLFGAAALFSLGCSSEAAEEQGSTTGGPGPSHPAPLDCAVAAEGVPSPIALSEGGRAKITLSLGEDVASATLATLPEGYRGRLDGTELVIEPPYGAGGQDAALGISVQCGEEDSVVDLALTVRRLAWEQTPAWNPQVDGPPSREYGSMWMDAEDPDRLLIFSGFFYEPAQFTPGWDLWQLDLASSQWQELTAKTEPPHLPGGRMAPIPGARANLYYGGILTEGDNASTPSSLVRFDYGPDDLTFAEANVTVEKSSGDYLPAFIYDAPRNRYITACGASDTLGYHCKVSAYHPDTGAWEKLTPAGDEQPDGRNGFFYVNDEENERLVMFSGEMGGSGWDCNCAEDTWALELAEEPVRWVKLAAPQEPPLGRRNGAYALDPIGHRMFIWGGTPDGKTTFPGLYAFDLDRGEEGWSKVETEMVPPERTSGMAVYDAARNRLLMGFGNGTAVYADLWALNL